MSSVAVKGWCPTMTRPMETGDGLLVRLHIRYGIVSAGQARIIADCATHYGNGLIDLTSRANLQFRGVTQGRYEDLLQALLDAGFTDEPRPERVANPGYLPPLGFLPVDAESGTLGLGLAFGRLEADQLMWLVHAVERYGNGTIHVSAWRSVFLPDIAKTDADLLLQEAAVHGLITDQHDPLRLIHACPGAPACSSAQGETRKLARVIAAQGIVRKTIHISGCAKGCAHGKPAQIMITARSNHYDIAFDATADAEAVHLSCHAQAVLDIMGTL